MTKDKFTELVNLYLDEEISEHGLAQLNCELYANAKRKDEFAEHCRMHQAMRIALNPKLSKRRFKSTHVVATCPRWIISAALVASLALGFVLFMLVYRDTSDVFSQPVLKGLKAGELAETDPLDRIGYREIRHFANTQLQRELNKQASLATQLRLIGLSPELTPKEKYLRSISGTEAQRPKVVRDNRELLAELQKISVMPSPKILRIESIQSEQNFSWPGGFRSSLASFK